MTEDNDLVKRLRLKRERCHDLSGVYYTEDADCQAAADRIEALTEQLEAARLDAKEAEAYSVWLEAKLAKAVKSLTARRDELKDHGYTTGHAIACGILTAVLAEIEGDKP